MDQHSKSGWLFPGLPTGQRRAAILVGLAFALFALGGIAVMILLLVWSPAG